MEGIPFQLKALRNNILSYTQPKLEATVTPVSQPEYRRPTLLVHFLPNVTNADIPF
jgi:hypothetical protein